MHQLTYETRFKNRYKLKNKIEVLLNVSLCRFENLPICLHSYKNNTLKILHSYSIEFSRIRRILELFIFLSIYKQTFWQILEFLCAYLKK